MSATAEYTDAMETDEFATLLSAPAEETPTPDSGPEPAADDDAPETTPIPEASAEPDAATPATPETPKVEEKPQWQIDLEAAQREAATLRGQVQNAAQQERARGEARLLQERQQWEAENERRVRETTIRNLDQLAATGQYSQAEVDAAKQQQLNEWAAKDGAVAQQQFQAQHANMQIGGVALDMDHATVRLHQAGIPSLAQQAALPEEYARQFFDAEETARYQKAIGIAAMAKKAPNAGFNALADVEYLETTFKGLALAGTIYKTLTTQHATEKAAWDQEKAELTMQLNRDGAPTAPPETPARGAGRKARTPDEHATETLNGASDILATWLAPA